MCHKGVTLIWVNRLVREVDDILALFTCLDEHKSMEHLPMYVADGPDNIPVTRL